jgi:hypothetical protein
MNAACKKTPPPSEPDGVADLKPRPAKAAAKRLARLSSTLASLRAPSTVRVNYVDLRQTYSRLRTLYDTAGAGHMTQKQVENQLLPGIRATHVRASDLAIEIGASGCTSVPHL